MTSKSRSIAGLNSICESFDLFLIDQFGVLHDGTRPYDGAIECLERLKAAGKSVILLSNSGKRTAANIERLLAMGFPRDCFDHAVTSGEVAWQGIIDRVFGAPFLPGKKMLLLGHEDYDYEFDRIGLTKVEDPAAADFVMIAASRGTKTSFAEYNDTLSVAVARNIPALCSNPDRMMLTPSGLQPSAGEIASLYMRLGGKVSFVGKPYPAIYAAARKKSPQSKRARTLAIGDSIEHDIVGGTRAGLSTALVRTGLSAELSDIELVGEGTRYGTFASFVLPGLYWIS